ncbi:MAG: hypothetical protein LBP89_09390 [Helicobacteraceae bacterium]|jgi:hypothetical protein|nr:hypothetical protein [Helicobacteraceae bacterium]
MEDQELALYQKSRKALEESQKERLKQLDALRKEREFLLNPLKFIYADEREKEPKKVVSVV